MDMFREIANEYIDRHRNFTVAPSYPTIQRQRTCSLLIVAFKTMRYSIPAAAIISSRSMRCSTSASGV